MNSRAKPDAKKIDAARSALTGCLAGVESAVGRLRSDYHTIQNASTLENAQFSHDFQNSTLMVALSLQRLEDASRRLIKRLRHDTKSFDKSLQSSIPILVTGRLANSWKHGLGGQQMNATVLNGIASIRRGDGYRDESGQERVRVIGMMVADSEYGTFVSTQLFELAVRHWALLLRPVVPTASEWAARILPHVKGSVIDITRHTQASVPLGATMFVELPGDLQSLLKDDAKKRGEYA